MCFVPVTMTSFSTSSEGKDKPKSVLASADATLTLSEGAGVVNVLRWVDGQVSVLGVGGCFLRTRSLCTVSIIFCSNEQIYTGFGGKVGQLVPERCIDGRKRRIRWRRVHRHSGILGMLSQGFNSFIFLLLVRSLRASNHCLYICWQRRFIAEVAVA